MIPCQRCWLCKKTPAFRGVWNPGRTDQKPETGEADVAKPHLSLRLGVIMLLFLLVDNLRVFITQIAKPPNQCSFKATGFLAETQTSPGIPRMKLPVTSWSSPARTCLTALCPPCLYQERLAFFLNSSCLLSECRLLTAFLEIVTLPSQVPAHFLPKAPIMRYHSA